MSNEGPFFDTIAANTSTAESIGYAGVPSGSDTDNGFINFSGEHDWFRIFLRAGEQYQFQTLSTGVGDPTLTLRDGSGAQLAFNDDFGSLNSLIRFTITTPGS